MKTIEFTLKNQDNQDITLSDYQGQYVVLYFYPKDFTPGCSQQACQYQASIVQFRQEDVKLFGISRDSADSHQKFKEKYGLQFDLLTDHKGRLSKQLGINMLGNLMSKRTTFIVDPKQELIKTLHDVDPEQDAYQVLEFIRQHKKEKHND
ncbi:MAG TPA: peroxiredoxin [Erysipelothrix sp.]|nr:peroxiredoxin [Erysipelothrix sp.]